MPTTARTATVLLGLLLIAWPAGAQSRLTLQEAIDRALASNHDLVLQRDNVAITGEVEARARGAYDFLLRLDGRGRVRTDPINSILSGAPVGALAPRTTNVLGAGSVSKLFGSGATLTAATSVSRDTSNSRLALLSSSWLTALTVDFRQPLLQGRQIDPTRRAIRLSAVDRSRSAAALARIANDTVAGVERAYWSLVAARRDIEVRRRALGLAEQQRTDTASRIDAGVAAESDLAGPTAEIERRRGDVFAAQEQAARAEHAVKQLIAAGPDDAVWNEPLTAVDAPDAARMTPAVGDALSTALARRPELVEARSQVERQDIEVDLARDRLRPTLDFVAGYALRGLAGADNPDAIPIGGTPIVVPDDLLGPLPQSWATLVTHRFADVGVGLSYAMPLGNRTAKADVAVAEIGRRQAETSVAQVSQRISIEVRNAVVALTTAGQRIDAARAGREAAAVQLQAEQDRFDGGLTTSFFVLTRQNELAQAELAEVAALVDYRKAFTDYLRATGSLLDERGIVVAAGRGESSR